MKLRRFHHLTTPVMTLLTVLVVLGWIGHAVADEQTVMVYKNPT